MLGKDHDIKTPDRMLERSLIFMLSSWPSDGLYPSQCQQCPAFHEFSGLQQESQLYLYLVRNVRHP